MPCWRAGNERLEMKSSMIGMKNGFKDFVIRKKSGNFASELCRRGKKAGRNSLKA